MLKAIHVVLLAVLPGDTLKHHSASILFAKGARQDRIKINKTSATTKCNKQEEDLFVFGIIHHACSRERA